jgi:TolA-binding protein
MDCEKFDQVAIDALYDELDELTLAAAKRHAETCPTCQGKWSGLKATRKVGVLPMVPVPAGFEHRILQAARDAQRNVPWPRRVGRAISWAGSYAMRPQTAMAAILLLMLGSSVIFVRVKPDRSAPGRVSVTERGVPEQPTEEVRPPPGIPLDLRPAPARMARREDDRSGGGALQAAPTGPSGFASPPPAAREAPVAATESKAFDRAQELNAAEAPTPMAQPAAPAADEPGGALANGEGRALRGAPAAAGAPTNAPAAAPSGASAAYLAAMELYNAGRFAEAERAFGEVASGGARNAASASLYAAKSAEAGVGCSRAAAKYESTASRYGATTPGAEALWGAATCYKANGNLDKARQLYLALRSVAGYRDRAEGELASLSAQRQQLAAKSAKAAARPAPAAAAEAAPAAAAPVAPASPAH